MPKSFIALLRWRLRVMLTETYVCSALMAYYLRHKSLRKQVKKFGKFCREIRILYRSGQKSDGQFFVLTIRCVMPLVIRTVIVMVIKPLNAELNPICHLLSLLGAHHIFHVSGLTLNISRGFLRGPPPLVCYWLTSVEINKHKIFDTSNAWITEL